MSQPGLLFLCVANSARSQMAEALARARYGDAVRVQSAGSEPSRVHPLALKACAAQRLDTEQLSSKGVDTIDPSTVDVVVTLCAEEYCPAYLHQATRLHWPRPDPAAAQPGEDEAAQLGRFLDVADRIAVRLSELDARLRPHPR
ncbi:MAG: arsenate reductase ArsC [Myxococcota bacterium]|nr:arsenate reductase ArsC [Myxococcota bacterium]